MIKVYLYAIMLFFSIWVLDAVDFNKILKQPKSDDKDDAGSSFVQHISG